MPKLTQNEKDFFEWFKDECERVADPNYKIIPACVPRSVWHPVAVAFGLYKKSNRGCHSFEFQRKHQRRFNTIMNRVAKKYGLKITDGGVFYGSPFL